MDRHERSRIRQRWRIEFGVGLVCLRSGCQRTGEQKCRKVKAMQEYSPRTGLREAGTTAPACVGSLHGLSREQGCETPRKLKSIVQTGYTAWPPVTPYHRSALGGFRTGS